MAHRGAGAPPPKTSSGGRFGSNQAIYHLSEPVTGSDGAPKLKQVKSLKLFIGEKNQPILTLDNLQKLEDAYSVNIHMFPLRGTKDNIVVCPKTAADPRPCPVCEVLNRDPTWYVCLTAIDRKKYSFDTGKNAGKVYTDLRRLVLITQTWIPRMDTNAERAKGWRGSLFEVSRSEPTKYVRDGQERLSFKDSPRMGDVWYFTEKYDEEKLKAEFEKRAADYGLPVEKFTSEFNYETLLKPKSHEQLVKIAADIRNDGTAIKSDAGGGSASAAVSSAATSSGGGGDPEAEINY